MRQLVFVVGVAFAGSALATNTNTEVTLSQIAARSVEAKYGRADAVWRDAGSLPRSVAAAVTPAGSVVLTSNYKGPSPLAGQVIDVAVKRTLPWSSISKAFAKSLPLVGTALAIKDIADAIRCREAPGGAAECDPGQSEQSTQCTEFRLDSYSDPKLWHCGLGAAGNYWAAELGTSTQSCSHGGTTYSNTVTYTFTATGPASGRLSWTSFGAACAVVSQQGAIQNFNQRLGSTVACPPVVVNGVTLYPVKDADGKCMTNVYQPASEAEVASKAETWGDKAKAPLVVGDLNAAGKPIDHPFPEIDPVPESVVGPRETTTHPDGSTTVRDTRYDLSPTPTGYEWTPSVVTKDYPPGAIIPPPGGVTDGTTTTGTPPKDEIITCGLPNTPPCKIDEGGTPSPSDPFEQNPASWFDPIRGVFENPNVTNTGWTWTFALPSGCSVLTVGPFFSQTVTIDLCQYQPMIHDLVTLIWLGAGVWACIGMVGRTFALG